MSTAVIWSKSKLDVEFQYGGRLGKFNGMSPQSHISHCRVLPLGEFTVMFSWATWHIAGWSHLAKSMSWSCHIAGCKNSIRHIENRFAPYLFVFLKCSLGFDEQPLIHDHSVSVDRQTNRWTLRKSHAFKAGLDKTIKILLDLVEISQFYCTTSTNRVSKHSVSYAEIKMNVTH